MQFDEKNWERLHVENLMSITVLALAGITGGVGSVLGDLLILMPILS
jgi:hypothetical protein